MTFEQAYRNGRLRAAEATAELLHVNSQEEIHLHPEPYLRTPIRLPDRDDEQQWTTEPTRWPGRGLRLEIGDRAYAHLVVQHRTFRSSRD